MITVSVGEGKRQTLNPAVREAEKWALLHVQIKVREGRAPCERKKAGRQGTACDSPFQSGEQVAETQILWGAGL